MKERVCQLSEVFQHEFANFSLPCESPFRLVHNLHFLILHIYLVVRVLHELLAWEIVQTLPMFLDLK